MALLISDGECTVSVHSSVDLSWQEFMICKAVKVMEQAPTSLQWKENTLPQGCPADSHITWHTHILSHTPFKCQCYANKGQPVVRLSLTQTFTFTYSTARTVVFPQKILIMIYKPFFTLSGNQQRRSYSEIVPLTGGNAKLHLSILSLLSDRVFAGSEKTLFQNMIKINKSLSSPASSPAPGCYMQCTRLHQIRRKKVNCEPQEQAWGI